MFVYSLGAFIVMAFVAYSMYIGRDWYKSGKFPVYVSVCSLIMCIASMGAIGGVYMYAGSGAGVCAAVLCTLLALISIGLQITDMAKQGGGKKKKK